MLKRFFPLLLWVVLLTGPVEALRAQTPEKPFDLIPYPSSVVAQPGSFTITAQTKVVVPKESKLFKNEVAQLQALLAGTGAKPLKEAKKGTSNVILFQYDKSLTADEGYQIAISPQQVKLTAKTPAGMFRAVQTLRQLLPVAIEQRKTSAGAQALVLPAVQITDEPAFGWRGMHLDVSRHFFTTDYLRKFIDLMALYKFNKLHLHLTDDQGWRIEIKKYPKLTEEGAWRTFNNHDSAVIKMSRDNPDFALDKRHIVQKNGQTLYGGFYTQAEMRDIIAYASARHIEIIPEVDMPGHMKAAIDAYPFLTCGEAGWGETFSVPICPCEESTYTFAENVFQEIIDLFPSQYIHLGADEVEKTTWAKSPGCQELMKREGLKNVEELQSYFVHRMQRFFESKGKKLIGWDEVLDGGIDSKAVVMFWRTWVPKAPLMAAKNGNQVVMTPNSPLYFDALPDKNSLRNVYQFEVVPKGLNANEAKSILGAQANIWTEYIPSEARAEYMYMPRMTALAEVVWSKDRNYTSYLNRMKSHYKRLDALNVRYRLPDLEGFLDVNVFTDKATLHPQKQLEDLQVRYTTDGSQPSATSPLLDKPLQITQTTALKLAAFTPAGLKGDTYGVRYEKQTLAVPAKVSKTASGLTAVYYKGNFKTTNGMKKATPTETLEVEKLQVPRKVGSGSFGIQFKGYLDVPESGVYSFFLTCDDGGVLRIADRLVVDNDGLHAPLEKSGQVALEKGLQPFQLDFIEGGGGYTLKLLYSKDGSQPQEVPQTWLKR
ncbi:family 20 glycosylhydrolase [Rufibacter glacialis]|uniref:beta-N-acetylhexosaminidase n=1 Tax=Rufibacter glacialis TaxID=1259555 RepID=A0A5M8Q918_9BACT|nr:family 20 glycosylhydrolase [Rufibacter glacialis]KAA6432455.1 family 20 glycosylhydrolase [Rufibacter glacialis]GGK78793.1 beta-N-acetylhexosaminidase [Rufibacter glacialis]